MKVLVNYNKLNNYFINRNITPKNEYTGIFEGKNLIVILMESTNEIFINEKEYPTLYKLKDLALEITIVLEITVVPVITK